MGRFRNTLSKTLVFALLSLALASPAGAQEMQSLADVIRNLSLVQHRGGWFRDRCIYFQRVHLDRYKKKSSEGALEELFYQRQSVAEVSADQNGEVIARLVSDTDGELNPKKVSPDSQNMFGAPRFLELLLFPMYPELVENYDITDLGVSSFRGRDSRVLRIYPRPDRKDLPLVEGLFYLDPASGAPLHLTIDRLHHFETLDSKLSGLLEFQAEVEYQTLPNGVTVPSRAEGVGNSKITRYKGYFTYHFEEWGYKPNPLYPDVRPYFEKKSEPPPPLKTEPVPPATEPPPAEPPASTPGAPAPPPAPPAPSDPPADIPPPPQEEPPR